MESLDCALLQHENDIQPALDYPGLGEARPHMSWQHKLSPAIPLRQVLHALHVSQLGWATSV